MSYRWKLFFSYMTLALVVGGVFYLAAISIFEKQLLSQSSESLLHQAQLVRTLVEREKEIQSPQALARLIGKEIGARVTLIAPDGRVLGESGVLDEQLALVENHLSRSEVQQALAAADGYGSAVRFSSTVGAKMLYTAVVCRMGETNGVVRLALPLTHLDQTKGSLYKLLGAACAALLVLALFLSHETIAGDLRVRCADWAWYEGCACVANLAGGDGIPGRTYERNGRADRKPDGAPGARETAT